MLFEFSCKVSLSLSQRFSTNRLISEPKANEEHPMAVNKEEEKQKSEEESSEESSSSSGSENDPIPDDWADVV